MVPAAACPSRGRRRARISPRPRTRRRGHRALPHRLRPRVRLPSARQAQALADEDALRESGLFSWKERASEQSCQRAAQRGDADNDCHAKAQSHLPRSTASSATASSFPSATRAARSSPSPGARSPPDDKVRPQVSQLAGDAHLQQVARALQSSSRQGSHPPPRLRHPGRRPDGLHLRLQRRIPQRHRLQRHRLHRAAGAAARPLQQKNCGQLRSRHRRSRRRRALARAAGQRGLRDPHRHPRAGLRSRSLRPPQGSRRLRATRSRPRRNISPTSSSARRRSFRAPPKAR